MPEAHIILVVPNAIEGEKLAYCVIKPPCVDVEIQVSSKLTTVVPLGAP